MSLAQLYANLVSEYLPIHFPLSRYLYDWSISRVTCAEAKACLKFSKRGGMPNYVFASTLYIKHCGTCPSLLHLLSSRPPPSPSVRPPSLLRHLSFRSPPPSVTLPSVFPPTPPPHCVFQTACGPLIPSESTVSMPITDASACPTILYDHSESVSDGGCAALSLECTAVLLDALDAARRSSKDCYLGATLCRGSRFHLGTALLRECQFQSL